MCYSIILSCVFFSKKTRRTVTIISILLQVVVVLYNLSNNFYNLSYYYQMITYLNTKNNLLLIYLLMLILLVNKKKTTLMFLSPALLLFWVTLHSTPIETSWLCLEQLSNRSNINTNLLNGIMLIHPPILYYFYVYFLKNASGNLTANAVYKHKTPSDSNNTILLAVLIYSSIILGCLWAEQELSWGGWWSWDFVELLALNFFLYILYKTHEYKSQSRRGKVEIIIIIISVMIVRFNIINSIHNFASIESQNQYFYYLLIIVLLGMTYIKFFSIRWGLKKNLSINIIFLISLNILYIVLIFNLFFVDFFNVKYNLQTNIKNIYLYILVLCLSAFLLKKNQSLTFQYTTLYIFLNLGLFDVCCILCMIAVSSLNITNRKMGNHIHALLPILFYCTTHQLYIFYAEYIEYNINSVVCLKLNNIVDIFKHISTNANNMISIYKNTFVVFDNHKNVFDISIGTYKHVFEKSILIQKNSVVELYSYNLQRLLQPVGLLIQIILFLILCFLSLFLKKKQSVSINI